MTCPTCGSENTLGAKYCGGCAVPIEESQDVACLTCGSMNSWDTLYCPNCGVLISSLPKYVVGTEPTGAPDLDIYVPVRLTIGFDEALDGSKGDTVTNRLFLTELNPTLLLGKWLFALPLYIALVFYGFLAYIGIFLAFWFILFTGRFPRGLFDYVRGFIRFQYKVYAYFPLLLTDHWIPDDSHPLSVEIDYPEYLSRPVLLFLKLPSFLFGIIGNLTIFAAFILVLIAIPSWWIILLIGWYPRSWFWVSSQILEWHCRVTVWQTLMRDEETLFGITTPVRLAVGVGVVGTIVVSIANLAFDLNPNLFASVGQVSI